MSAVAPSPLMACHVMFHRSSKCFSHPFEHLNSMPIFSVISSTSSFALQPSTAVLSIAKPSKQFMSISPYLTPHILICSETSLPCTGCCSTESQFLRCVNRVTSGIPYSRAISLEHLTFLLTTLITLLAFQQFSFFTHVSH